MGRDKVGPMILEGFREAANEAGSSVSGGQTVMNPWLSVGGVATSICRPKERGHPWGLAQGLCPEVSGGLLIVMPREEAAAFCKDMERLEGNLSWIIGIVEKGDRDARVIDKPRIIE